MLFRPKVLKKISTPDELDDLLSVTNSTGWIVLLIIISIFFVSMVWAVWGSVSTVISGNGFLVGSGGITKITAEENGYLTDWHLTVGQIVHKGELLGILQQPESESKIRSLESDLRALKTNSEKYDTRLAELKQLSDLLNTTENIRAPFDGRIVAVNKKNQEQAAKGEQLVAISDIENNLRLKAQIFVPGVATKKLKIDSEIKIELGNVSSDKYGYMLGKITAISQYPVDAKTISNYLNNDMIITWLTDGAKVPIFQVTVYILPDKNNYSGYAWTSLDGPPVKIEEGTPLTAFCVVEKQRPIYIAFEWLKQLFEAR